MKQNNRWQEITSALIDLLDQTTRVQRVLIRTTIALVLCAISLYLNLFNIEAFFYDARMRLKGAESPHPAIHLITLDNDDRSVMESLRLSPMQAHKLALLRLVSQKPKAIVYLANFSPAQVQSEWDTAEEFVDLVRDAESQGVRVFFGTEMDLAGEILPPYPLSLLPHYPAALRPDLNRFSNDGVLRRATIAQNDVPFLYLKLAQLDVKNDVKLLDQIEKTGGAYYYEPNNSWELMIRFPDTTIAETKIFPESNFASLLQETKNESLLKDKVVLVGELYREDRNFVATPFSKALFSSPALYVQAAIVDSVLKGTGIIKLSKYYDAVVTFFFCLLLIYFAMRFTPSQGILLLLLTSGSLFGASLLLFKTHGLWINIVHPLFAIFSTYYLVVPYRAILEYRKRWKVQEEHELLIQVEEMKGNFLSLMSHDLKTPVARIQGLAELILRQGNLSDEQESELWQIIQSTENLNKFITKILELTKVESSNIKLNLKSKDINQIIELCVEKLAFTAKRKEITLKTELEPLFPINLDAPLIIQVLTNIIDNAIQYSPIGSTVLIKSAEIKDKIEIRVSDTGRGMDNKERKMLFTKFYRGENPASEQIKGSGLGLYLSKYFIELHKGSIDVESEKGAGSTFTISLPLTA